jgi:hypothetical protein
VALEAEKSPTVNERSDPTINDSRSILTFEFSEEIIL